MPVSHASDAYPEESASYVTVIRPKTNPNPYSSTIYNKNIRNSIYHLAANVNSLEPVDKKPHWVHSLLQKEITYQPPSTTPQVILAYSPKIYEPQSPSLIRNPEKFTLKMEESTTPTPMTSTTDATNSRFNYPVIAERVPMFLIIQGHSKVKTYGPDDSDKKPEKHEVKMVPVTVNEDPIVKHVVSLDTNGSEIGVKHLHKLHTPEPKPKASLNRPNKKVTNSPMDSLLSLLDSSLANFALTDNRQTRTKSNVLTTKSNEVKTVSTSTTIGHFVPTTIRPFDLNVDS